jgi:hypothetical protein
MSTKTNTATPTEVATAAAILATREKALASGARADGALMKAAKGFWYALETEGTTTYAEVIRQAADLDNTRDVQRVAYLGLIVAEHGCPTLPRGGVDRLLKTLGGILGNAKDGGGTEAIRACVEDADDADEAVALIQETSRQVNATRREREAEAARRKAGQTETPEGETEGTEGDGTETAPEAPKARGNAALIADALAAIGRVNAETLTEAETLALASLIQAVAALGKASQEAKKAA